MTVKSHDDDETPGPVDVDRLTPEQVEMRARLAELAELKAEVERLQAEVDPRPVRTEAQEIELAAQAARDEIDSLNARLNRPARIPAEEIRRRRRDHFKKP